MVSLLRKKRQLPDPSAMGGSSARPSRELSHSLSLPDLTTPLLDPSSWEEIPDFLSSIPSLPNISKTAGHTSGSHGPRALFSSTATATATARNRSPSFITGNGTPGSPVAFHKPFGTWQVVQSPHDALGLGSGMREPPVPPLVYRGDFRKSTWLGKDAPTVDMSEGGGRQSVPGYGAGEARRAQSRRRKKGRVAENLNVMLVGGKRVGKTSFLNLLRDTSASPDPDPSTPHKHHNLLSPLPAHHTHTPSSPTSPGPPVTPSTPHHFSTSISSASSSPLSPTSPLPSVPVHLQRPVPTSRLSASTLVIERPAEKIQLRIVDSPGLDLRGDDGPAMHARQRERGVQALLSVAEERYEEVLREESKVVRRQLSGGSGLIHLCIYLIDARAILLPAEDEIEVDWSGLSLSDSAKPTSASGEMQDLRPNLAKVEVDIIRRLGGRMNVLPILTHADCLSTAELTAVRQAVKRDIGEAFRQVEGKGFGLFGTLGGDDDVPGRNTPTGHTSSSDESPSPRIPRHPDNRPPTPASTIRGQTGDDGDVEEDDGLPYAVFAPGTGASGTREYSWGIADVRKVLDLHRVREAILDTHAKALRLTTREVLYERYRTERLLARGGSGGYQMILSSCDVEAFWTWLVRDRQG